jgi:hypothetical protein
MAKKQIRYQSHENVFQAFARALKTGELPADAKLFPMKQGVPEPEAQDGFVTVGSVPIRPREAFAVGVPATATPAFEVGESSAQKPMT